MTFALCRVSEQDMVEAVCPIQDEEERPSVPFLGAEPVGKLSISTWQVVEREGVKILTREHPLTAGGEEIGHFRLLFLHAAARMCSTLPTARQDGFPRTPPYSYEALGSVSAS
jgi:hypothetical protein